MNLKGQKIHERAEQIGLWEFDCARNCIAWNFCGGSTSAPCNCAWPKSGERPHCGSCPIICRKRRVIKTHNNATDDFYHHIRSGLPLWEVIVSHPANSPNFPLLIPIFLDHLAVSFLLYHLQSCQKTFVNLFGKKNL